MRILTNRAKAIRERLDINAPIEEVFNFTNDYRDKSWDPFVKEIKAQPLINGFPDKGTKVKVTAWNGFKMSVEYISYDHPHCAAIKMTEGPVFLESFSGCWRFLYIDKERTAVVFLYNFKMKAGYEWMEQIAQYYFRWDMHRRLKALKRTIEADHVDPEHYQYAV